MLREPRCTPEPNSAEAAADGNKPEDASEPPPDGRKATCPKCSTVCPSTQAQSDTCSAENSNEYLIFMAKDELQGFR